MRFFILCILFCGVVFAQQTANSTIMVRCDDGSEYDFSHVIIAMSCARAHSLPPTMNKVIVWNKLSLTCM